MGKQSKLVIMGRSGVGKTSLLQQAIYGEFANKELGSTIEDVYLTQVETERGVKETLRIYDIGFKNFKTVPEIPKYYYNFGDGFMLVYSIDKLETFRYIEMIKKEIDKVRDKKDVTIIAIGNKTDLIKERQVDYLSAQSWATKEKVRLFECNINNPRSVSDAIIFIGSRLTQPPVKSTFIGSRKLKQQQASMD